MEVVHTVRFSTYKNCCRSGSRVEKGIYFNQAEKNPDSHGNSIMAKTINLKI